MLGRRAFLLTAMTAPAAATKLSTADDAFLDDLSRRSFQYFWDQAIRARESLAAEPASTGRPTRRNEETSAALATPA